MKITKTIKKEETREVDINLPYFSKDADFFYCIIDEKEALRVMWKEYGSLPPSASISTSVFTSVAANAEQISEDEFNEALQKALNYLRKRYRDVVVECARQDAVREEDMQAEADSIIRDEREARDSEAYDKLTINEGAESESEL